MLSPFALETFAAHRSAQLRREAELDRLAAELPRRPTGVRPLVASLLYALAQWLDPASMPAGDTWRPMTAH